MGSVFRDASRVVVWLGSRDCTKTMEILQELVLLHNYPNRHSVQRRNLATETSRLTTRLLALRFFDQPWFSRVWVVQEYILAQEIQLLAGYNVVSLEPFRDAVHCLKSIFDEHLIPDDIVGNANFDYLQLQKQIHRTSYLFFFRDTRMVQLKGSSSTELRQTLLQCFLDLTRGRDCSDTRDYIYAILGLASDNLDITPDYSLSIREVLSDFAVRCLVAGETSVLHESGFQPTRGNDEPSFAPIHTFGGNKTLRLNESSLKCSAATKYPIKVVALTDCKISIRGLWVDNVVGFANIIDKRIRDPTEGGSYKVDAFGSWGESRRTYFLFKDWFLGYEKERDWSDKSALFLEEQDDRKRLWSPPPYTHLLLFDCFVRIITLEAESYATYPKSGITKDFWSRSSSSILAHRPNRLLFKTQKGYLGVGSHWTQVGDPVVIFDGFKTPFTLRDEGTEGDTGSAVWNLVGDCYLLGWMHGDYFGHEVVEEMPPKMESGDQEQKRDEKVLVKTSFVLC